MSDDRLAARGDELRKELQYEDAEACSRCPHAKSDHAEIKDGYLLACTKYGCKCAGFVAEKPPRKYQIALLVETNTPLKGKDILDEIEMALTGVGVRPIAAQAREIIPASNKEEPHGG